MKRILLMLLPLALLFAGCKYDDTDIWNELNAQKAKLAELESRCNSMNSDIGTLRQLVEALQSNVSVTSVASTSNGYVITFSDGNTATISNGKDGKNGENGRDGKDAEAPVISVAQGEDGTYYWTVNGEFLTDADGNKVAASGVAPQLKIADGKWMASYDGGKTWNEVQGQESAPEGIFKSVTTDSENAYFTLADGTVITLPLASTAVKLQLVFDDTVFEGMKAGQTVTTTYEIKAAEDAVVDLQTFENNGWTVKLTESSERAGSIAVTAPDPFVSGKILFILTDDKGGSFVKVVSIEGGENPAVTVTETVDATGGELVLPYAAASADCNQDWVTIVSVGENVVLNVLSNDTYGARSAVVTLDNGTVININQLQNDAIIISEPTVNISSEEQSFEVVYKTNIDQVETTFADSWLALDVNSRALVEKVVKLKAEANTQSVARSTVVIFKGNDVTQTITVIQDCPEQEVLSVSEVLDRPEGEVVILGESTVMAICRRGYVVSDGAKAVFVYDSSNTPKVGDVVTFTATRTVYNGVAELTKIKGFETVGSADVNYPEPADITAGFDDFESAVADYVSVTGVISSTDSEANLAVEGADTPLNVYYPDKSLGLASVNGHNVTLTGYYNGKLSTSPRKYLIVTGFVDNGAVEIAARTITEVVGLEDNTPFKTTGALVVALCTKGFVVSDGTSDIFVYTGNVNGISIGDKVAFQASKVTYNGVPEATTVTDLSVESSGNNVSYPEASDITTTIDTYESGKAEFIKFTGDLVKSGSYYNVNVPGAATRKGSIYNPFSSLGADGLVGKTVTVTGYFNGFSSQDVYVNIIATEIKAVEGGDEPGGETAEPKAVTVAEFNAAEESSTQPYQLTGTIGGNINTTYGNFDLTDETGTVYVYGLTATNLGYGASNDKSYASLGLKAGDKVTLIGFRGSFNDKIEVMYAYYVSHEAGEGGDEPGGGDEPALEDDFTSNVTWTLGTNASTQEATVNGTAGVSVLKLGTSKAAGEATLSVPKGTKKVTFYAVSWNNKPTKLVAKVGDTEIYSVDPAANAGANNNSPYTLTVASSDKYTMDLGSALEADTEVTVTTSGTNTRVIIFAIKAE